MFPTPEDLDEKALINIVLPSKHFSVSQFNIYNTCGRRYYYRYVLKRQEQDGSTKVLGQLGHKIAERTLQQYMKDDCKVVPSAEFVSDTVSTVIEDYTAKIDYWEDRHDVADPISAFEKEIRVLVELFRAERVGSLLPRKLEHKFTALLCGKIPFLGYIDIIDRDPDVEAVQAVVPTEEIQPTDVIRDFKFVQKKYGPHQVLNSVQLSAYAGLNGVCRVGYDLIVRAQKKSGPRIVSMPEDVGNHVAVRTNAELIWAQEVLWDTAAAISKGVFPRADPESWVCSEKWCSFYGECRGKGRK